MPMPLQPPSFSEATLTRYFLGACGVGLLGPALLYAAGQPGPVLDGLGLRGRGGAADANADADADAELEDVQANDWAVKLYVASDVVVGGLCAWSLLGSGSPGAAAERRAAPALLALALHQTGYVCATVAARGWGSSGAAVDGKPPAGGSRVDNRGLLTASLVTGGIAAVLFARC